MEILHGLFKVAHNSFLFWGGLLELGAIFSGLDLYCFERLGYFCRATLHFTFLCVIVMNCTGKVFRVGLRGKGRIRTNTLGAVGYSNNGGPTCLGVSLVENLLAAGHSLLCQRYRVVVSRQSDSRSARTLKDLELSCLLYCGLNLVVQGSKVTRIL